MYAPQFLPDLLLLTCWYAQNEYKALRQAEIQRSATDLSNEENVGHEGTAAYLALTHARLPNNSKNFESNS